MKTKNNLCPGQLDKVDVVVAIVVATFPPPPVATSRTNPKINLRKTTKNQLSDILYLRIKKQKSK
jgi:hypothetical protein